MPNTKLLLLPIALLLVCAVDAQPRGFLDFADTFSARGWACDPRYPQQALNVQVFIDGNIFGGNAVANQVRSDFAAVAAQCGGNGNKGFTIQFSQAVRNILTDGRVHQIFAQVQPYPSGTAVALSGTPRAVGGVIPTPTCTPTPPAVIIRGFIETASRTQTTGWACTPQDGSQVLFVDFYINGVFYAGRAPANILRPDVAGQCGGFTNHGFNFVFPQNVLLYFGSVPGPWTLQAVATYSGTSSPLQNSPQVIYF